MSFTLDINFWNKSTQDILFQTLRLLLLLLLSLLLLLFLLLTKSKNIVKNSAKALRNKGFVSIYFIFYDFVDFPTSILFQTPIYSVLEGMVS